MFLFSNVRLHFVCLSEIFIIKHLMTKVQYITLVYI